MIGVNYASLHSNTRKPKKANILVYCEFLKRSWGSYNNVN